MQPHNTEVQTVQCVYTTLTYTYMYELSGHYETLWKLASQLSPECSLTLGWAVDTTWWSRLKLSQRETKV